MKFKYLSLFILTMLSSFSLNAFAYLYGAKVTIKNNTNDNLLVELSGDNNISESPYVSKDGKNPDDMSLISIEPNGMFTIFIDNYDWSGWLYKTKVTKFGFFKDHAHAQPTLLSEGTISINTGATLWNMSAYFDKENLKVVNSDYSVTATPDYEHSKFGTAGSLADMTIIIDMAKSSKE